MDSMCASMGSRIPGGYQSTRTNTPKDCTLACVKGGSKFVLYNSARKTTLQLDDQDKARDFAGQGVRVMRPISTIIPGELVALPNPPALSYLVCYPQS